jgi:AraC family transcriptional regulator of adaptative response/methylated-DNA-[protein]-cysteine methyltransferase
MISAMRNCDGLYDGQFYVGVHSTGIYCLPSCKAKTPLLKNVVFYPTREDAITAGLRGCKRCRSEKFPDVLPEWLHGLLAYMNDHRHERLSESELMKMAGVEISTVRRYFKQHLGVTPLAFHRRLRLSYAKNMIENGTNYLTAAFDSGWESSSGFRAAFQRQFGCSPGSCYGHK